MPLEIERKFLLRAEVVDAIPDYLTPDIIKQCYIPTKSMELRLRCKNDQWTLTVKEGVGMVREEREISINPNQANFFQQMCMKDTVEKLRYTDGRWEIDVYQERHEGLIIAEVELRSVDEFLPELPFWMVGYTVREVTGEPQYTNAALAETEEIPAT